MSITVWTEQQTGKWTDCVFSAYGMALEYGGFSAFPLGAGTAAEREAFAGPQANDKSGTTLKQADALSLARYGITLPTLKGTLANALAAPNQALVVTGNYSRLSGNSALVKDVYAWNNYDTKNPLPSVDHAVTIITNPDGTLTWLDPTAKEGSTGVPVTAAEVEQFAGSSRVNYPVRVIQQGALAATGNATVDNISPVMQGILGPYEGRTFADLLKDPSNANINWSKVMSTLGKSPTDTLTAQDITKLSGVLVGGKINPLDLGTGFNAVADLITNNPLSAIAGALVSIVSKLTNPANWIHLGAMAAGVALVGFGLYVVTKDVIQSPDSGGGAPPMPIILKEGA
jgi:hypothetical protein